MADHEEMTLMMSLALDGQLCSSDQSRLEDHLMVCSACQAKWLRWKQVDALLSGEPVVSPPLGFSSRVLERVDVQARQRRRVRNGLLLLGGSLPVWSMMVAALLLAVLLWLGSDPAVLALLAQVAVQIAGAIGMLLKALRIGLAGVARPEMVPLVVSYACVVVATLVMWARVVFGLSKRGRVASILA